MKKIALIILSISILFCGCNLASSTNASLPPSFKANAEITLDEMTYETVIERYADSRWKVEFIAPDAVKGLIFTVDGEETEISFNGLHFTFDTNKFPVGSVVKLFTDSFDRIMPTELIIIEGETTDFASGEVDGMSYAFTLNKNCIPLSLDLGDCGMKVNFVEFELIPLTE